MDTIEEEEIPRHNNYLTFVYEAECKGNSKKTKNQDEIEEMKIELSSNSTDEGLMVSMK